jgi:Flp pilus assembly protein TadG
MLCNRSNATEIKNSFPIKRKRRGAVWPLFLAILTLLLAGLALAVDAALLWQARQELQVATDASSLAAVQYLADDRLLLHRPGDKYKTVTGAMQAAQDYATLHHVLGQPLALVPGDPTAPDVVFGFFDSDHQSLQPATQSEWDSTFLNTVEVTGRRTHARDTAVGLFFARLFRLPASDVTASSTAILDHQIAGFRPWGTITVPMMPLALLSDPTGMDEESWEAQIDKPLAQGGGGRDWYAFDKITKQWLSSGKGDGLPEFVLKLPISSASETAGNGKVLHFAKTDDQSWLRQASLGLSGDDLSAWNGQLTLDQSGFCSVPEGELPTGKALEQLVETLTTLHQTGEARIWSLYLPMPSLERADSNVMLRGFVAARIADVQISEGDQPFLIIILQPTILITSTALTDSVAENNPYIAKARLLR